jgi:hypothetical protein
MKTKSKLFIGLMAVSLFISSCSNNDLELLELDGNATSPTSAKDITFTENQLYPEGVGYDRVKDLFYVGSITKGKIGSVDRNGKWSFFADDPELISTVGVHINSLKRELYACVGDVGFSEKSSAATATKTAKLAVYNIDTKEKKAIIDFTKISGSETTIVNDVTIDEFTGNVYVTDSFLPIIYKVDKNLNATIFAKNALFEGEGFNLNGIVFNPRGFLIVAKSNSGELLKVDVKDPTKVTKITISEDLVGVDGLILNNPNEILAIVNSGQGRVLKLSSTDQWKSASLKGKFIPTEGEFPTTGVKARNTNYVLNSKLGDVFSGAGNANATSFTLQVVKF